VIPKSAVEAVFFGEVSGERDREEAGEDAMAESGGAGELDGFGFREEIAFGEIGMEDIRKVRGPGGKAERFGVHEEDYGLHGSVLGEVLAEKKGVIVQGDVAEGGEIQDALAGEAGECGRIDIHEAGGITDEEDFGRGRGRRFCGSGLMEEDGAVGIERGERRREEVGASGEVNGDGEGEGNEGRGSQELEKIPSGELAGVASH
jgi:hypothetical protein